MGRVAARRGAPVVIAVMAAVAVAALPDAAAGQLAVTPRVGTTGLGLDLTLGLARSANLRLGGGGGLSVDERRTIDDIRYQATFEAATAMALLDWHPGGGAFRASIGLFWNGNEIEGRARPEENAVYEIGDAVFPAAAVGEIDGRVGFESIAPYAGIGWGNAVGGSGRWALALDLGVLYQGEPDLQLIPDLPPDSPLNTIPAARALFLAELGKEEARAEEEMREYRYFPVVALGVSYRF